MLICSSLLRKSSQALKQPESSNAAADRFGVLEVVCRQRQEIASILNSRRCFTRTLVQPTDRPLPPFAPVLHRPTKPR